MVMVMMMDIMVMMISKTTTVITTREISGFRKIADDCRCRVEAIMETPLPIYYRRFKRERSVMHCCYRRRRGQLLLLLVLLFLPPLPPSPDWFTISALTCALQLVHVRACRADLRHRPSLPFRHRTHWGIFLSLHDSNNTGRVPATLLHTVKIV